MNISYAWIRSLLPGLDATTLELADILAMQGAPVDGITDTGGPLRDIRIARVIEASQHPNADRLKLCMVDAGTGEIVQVVCGATNVKAGGVYPFAPIGAHLPGDIVIKKSKIRGSESQGMLCSARELGLGKDHDGIMELPQDTPIGASLIDVLQLDDARLVVDVTPNRPDLLSHIGIAREIGATVAIEPRLYPVAQAGARRYANDAQSFETDESERRAHDGSSHADRRTEIMLTERAQSGATEDISVDIQDPDLCPRYLGLVIRGIQVGPSPAWLSGRLRAIGLRPISNVVDATNYILHELGQPLHAFDMAKSGSSIVVRRAANGETITTLDGVERKLTNNMLVIADSARPIAVAGVMGGANSEVDDATTAIVLECALFNPASIRATRRALGLSTDASYRYERGVDPDSMVLALHRAADLIVAVAGGEISHTGVDAGVPAIPRSPISLRLTRVAQVLGMHFGAQGIIELLAPLGFDVHKADDETLSVRVPGHRSYDVTREEDLIEEIARRYGYDNFADDLRAFRPTAVPDDAGAQLEDRLRDILVAHGLLESRTLAFAADTAGDVELLLPLSTAEGRLRSAIAPALLRRAEFNFARAQRHIRMFEIGTAFRRAHDSAIPREERHVAALLTGSRTPPHWTGDAPAFDLWDIQSLASSLAKDMALTIAPFDATASGAPLPSWADPSAAWVLTRADGATDTSTAGADGMLPAGSAGVLPVGFAARVLPAAIDAPAWADAVHALEIDLSHAQSVSTPIAVRPIPAYPAVERDLALLVPHELDSAQVLASIQQSAGPLLETAFPFDVYRGKGIDEAMRSVALRLRFRATDRTLTDEEVDRALARVLNRLKEDHGIDRRA